MRHLAFRCNSSFDPFIDTLNNLADEYGCSKARMIRIYLRWVLADTQRRGILKECLDNMKPF